MHPCRGIINVVRLIEKKRHLARERLRLARKRCYRKNRTAETQCRFTQRERIRRALEPHHGKAPLPSGLDPRLQFLGCLFKTSFHRLLLSSNRPTRTPQIDKQTHHRTTRRCATFNVIIAEVCAQPERSRKLVAGQFNEPTVFLRLSFSGCLFLRLSFSACLAENPGSFPALLHSSLKSCHCGFIDRLTQPADGRRGPGFSARHAENDSQDLARGNTHHAKSRAIFKMTHYRAKT